MQKLLCLIFLASSLVWGQGTPNCQQTATFTAAVPGPAIQTTTGGAAGCTGFRLTWSVTGFTAVEIQLEGSQDNSTFAAFSGATIVIEGSNPTMWTSATTSNSIVVRASLPWVRVNITGVTGSGTIITTILGYSGTTAQWDSGGGGAPSGPAGGDLGGTYPNPTVLHLGHVTDGSLANAGLTNPSTSVNSQTCTLGGSCTVSAAPSGSAGGDLSGSYPNPGVAQVNGAAVPTSATVAGTNSSKQIVARTVRGTTLNPQMAANSSAAAAGTPFCDDGAGNTTTSGCSGGGGGGGGGVTVFSGTAVALASTVYFPIGGGGLSSSTEANVQTPAPAAATIANFYVNLSTAPGMGTSVAFTWRDATSSQALTCTISGTATSCSDTSHNFSPSAGDLLDIQAVPTGVISATPNVIMTATYGSVSNSVSAIPPYLSISGSLYGPVFLFTAPPSIGSLTWVNQGGASATNSNGAILMAAPASSGDNLRYLHTASYPATPFTFTVGVLPNFLAQNFFNCGIGISDGTKFVTPWIAYQVDQGGVNGKYTEWNSTTSFNSTPASLLFSPFGPVYLTVTDDGTNITAWVSGDVLDLKRFQVYQQGRTSFLTPSQIGLVLDVNNGSFGESCLFFHWTGI